MFSRSISSFFGAEIGRIGTLSLPEFTAPGNLANFSSNTPCPKNFLYSLYKTLITNSNTPSPLVVTSIVTVRQCSIHPVFMGLPDGYSMITVFPIRPFSILFFIILLAPFDQLPAVLILGSYPCCHRLRQLGEYDLTSPHSPAPPTRNVFSPQRATATNAACLWRT